MQANQMIETVVGMCDKHGVTTYVKWMPSQTSPNDVTMIRHVGVPFVCWQCITDLEEETADMDDYKWVEWWEEHSAGKFGWPNATLVYTAAIT